MNGRRTRVVVAGGGIGGLTVAHRLSRRASGHVDITVIEPADEFRFAPSQLWMLEGKRRPDQFTRPLARMLPKGVERIAGSVTGTSPEANVVHTTTGDIEFDRLVVSLGTPTDPSALAGFAESAHDLYHVDGARSARDAIETVRSGRIVILVSSMPFKCPAAPYEAAFIIESLLRKRGVRSTVEVAVVTPETLPMPTAGASMGHRVAALLADRGIAFHPEAKAESIDPVAKVVKLERGDSISFDVLIGVPTHRPPSAIAGGPLAGPSGYAPVHPRTLETKFPGVYVIGDSAAVPIADGKFLPKAGVFAHFHGNVVADRIADEVAGRAPSAEFDGRGSCFLELGGGRGSRASGDFTTSPPNMRMNMPGPWWHLAKVAVEKYWLHPVLWR